MPETAQIKAVVFDAVGTVMYPEPSVAQAYQRSLSRHCGKYLEESEIATAVKQSLAKRSAVADLSTNEAGEHEFWADLIRQFCPESDGFDACFNDLFTHFGDPDSWRCFSDVTGLVTALKERDYTVAIASNFDLRLNPVCDGLSELSAVKHRVISSVAGWRKPAPEFFHAVLESLSLPPEQVLMVGDDAVNDIQGAMAVGMQAAWIHRTPQNDDESVPCLATLSSLTELPALLDNQKTSSRKVT